MTLVLRRAAPVALLLLGATLALWVGLWLRGTRPPVSPLLPPAPTLEAVFCPAGNGEAAWIRTPHGKFIVVGCGTPGSETAFLESLRGAGTQQIAALFLPYPYAEDIGGAEAVLRGLPVAAVYEPTPQSDVPVNQWHKTVRLACREEKIPLKTIWAGQVITIDGVHIEVLAPAKIPLATPPSGANNSLVLRVKWRKTAFLLAGGLMRAGEDALLSRPGAMEADVLRVARMGDKDATSAEFLRRVNPRFLVISCAASALPAPGAPAGVSGGDEPLRGETYPNEETLRRLRAVGVPLYQTEAAPLKFVSDGSRIRPPDAPQVSIP